MQAIQVAAKLAVPMEQLEEAAHMIGIDLSQDDKTWLEGRTRFLDQETAAGIASNLSSLGYLLYQESFEEIIRCNRSEPGKFLLDEVRDEVIEETVHFLLESEQIISFGVAAIHCAAEGPVSVNSQIKIFQAITWARLSAASIATYATFEDHSNWTIKHKTKDWNSDSNQMFAAALMERIEKAEADAYRHFKEPANQLAAAYKVFVNRYQNGETNGVVAQGALRGLNRRLNERLSALVGEYTVQSSCYISQIAGAILSIAIEASERGHNEVQKACLEGITSLTKCLPPQGKEN